MNPVISLLLCVACGTVVLMAGILITRESGSSLSSSFKHSLVWGTGFFVAMSMQILAIARL